MRTYTYAERVYVRDITTALLNDSQPGQQPNGKPPLSRMSEAEM